MTFKHKLSKRLALSKSVWLTAVVAVLAACNTETQLNEGLAAPSPPPPLPPPGTFTPPDILTNASFEAGWDGFKDNSGGDPGPSVGPATVTRSQEQAAEGTWSVRSTFSNIQGTSQAVAFTYLYGVRGDVYVRFYFYATAFPSDAHKWVRFHAGTSFFGVRGGLYTEGPSGIPGWRFANSSPGNVRNDFTSIGVPTLNTWHSFEIHYDNANGRARFWYDGQPVVPSPGGNNYVQGEWLYSGGGPDTDQGFLVFDDTINNGNTRSGTIYYDRIAVSTQRIGP